jgi:hypothetical protein
MMKVARWLSSRAKWNEGMSWENRRCFSAIVVAVLSVLCTCTLFAATIRSSSAKAEFKREHPCPANGHRSGPCPGYVIDHIVPLACNGADVPRNMQWQTIADAKAKDRWERDCELWLRQ